MPAGFGNLDYVAVAVINDGLHWLAQNPSHLEFILSGFYNYPEIKKIVGPNHIKECIEFITKNRIHVSPFYEIDIKRRPSIVVVANGTEDGQFIGDYGTQVLGSQFPPTIYTEFDAKAIKDDTITVATDLKLDEKLWHGVIIKNGDFETKLEGVNKKSTGTVLYLKDKVPTGTSLKNWKSTSSYHQKGMVINASMDDVTIQCKLTTTGDFAVHRLLSIVVRYCIKSRRLLWDEYGLQVASFSYSAPMASDDAEKEFDSVYTITGKFTDHWIEREFDIVDSALKMDYQLVAHSTDPKNEDVEGS